MKSSLCGMDWICTYIRYCYMRIKRYEWGKDPTSGCKTGCVKSVGSYLPLSATPKEKNCEPVLRLVNWTVGFRGYIFIARYYLHFSYLKSHKMFRMTPLCLLAILDKILFVKCPKLLTECITVPPPPVVRISGFWGRFWANYSPGFTTENTE